VEFYGWRNQKMAKQKVSMKLIDSLALARAEIEAGVLAKTDHAPLILAPAESSFLKPCPLDLIGWGLTNYKT
jgi:hypothetical protein